MAAEGVGPGVLRAPGRSRWVAVAVAALLAAPGGAAGRDVLRESFDENRGAWVELDDETVRLSVGGGSYTLEFRRAAGYYVSSPPEEVSGAGDLDLEGVLERRSGGPDHGHGLFWDGRLDPPHSFRFLVLYGDGTYSLGSQREGKFTYLVQREPSPGVPKGNARVVVRVRRRGAITQMYVNGARLAVALSGTPFGGRVGLYVTRPGVTAADSFEVSESESAPISPSGAADGLCTDADPPSKGGESPAAPCRKALDVLASAAVLGEAGLAEADALARKSVSLGPRYAPGHVVAARVALERCRLPENTCDGQGLKTGVLPLARKALALAPDLPEALNVLAEAELALGELGRAEGALARSLELAPGLWSTHLVLGTYLARTGQPGPGRAAWARAASLVQGQEGKAAALVLVARALLRAGDPAAAIEMLQSSVALRPRFPGVLKDLGDLLTQGGRPEEAAEAYRMGLEIAESAEVRRRFALAEGTLAKGLLAQGRLDEALARARNAVEQDPGVAWLRLELGRVCERKGLADEAIAAYEAAVTLQPGSFDAHRSLARAYSGKAAVLSGREAVLNRAVALAEYQLSLPLAPDPETARQVEHEIEALKRLGSEW